VDRFVARNQDQERWLAETADALACAEGLAARLVDLRGTSDLSAVLSIQAEIAVLRRRVDELEIAHRILPSHSALNCPTQSAWGPSPHC